MVGRIASILLVGLLASTLALSIHVLPVQAEEIVSSRDIEAALDKLIPRGIGVQAKRNVILSIPFEVNSAQLKPAATPQLDEIRAALNLPALRAARILVAGHTDASGSAAYNQSLSKKRAEAVKDYLVAHGVDGERMQTEGHGEAYLLLPNEPLHTRNRRVELTRVGDMDD